MNKQTIKKAELFISGLKQRYLENKDIFLCVSGEYTSGTAKYPFYIADGICDFNKEKTGGEFDTLLDGLISKANLYDTLRLLYKDRISTLEICAVGTRVTSKTINEDIKTPLENDTKKSVLSPKKAQKMLLALDFVTPQGKLKNTHIRKYNQAENILKLIDPYIREFPQNKVINVYDLACGKSYLSFFINYYICEVLKRKCFVYGVDINENVTKSSEKISEKAGFKNMKFICADLLNFMPETHIDIAVSLHACDVATDYAIACAVNNNADEVFFVPCCHKELNEPIAKNAPDSLSFITEHKILSKRFADIFTDSYRVKVLEEIGYDMTLTEFVSPLDTPKNLIMLGKKKKNFVKKDTKITDEIEKSYGVSPILKKLIF